MGNPQVTVLMAVYNGSLFLRDAIESILSQTVRDFCFLIVDDASTDSSREIVRSYQDPRIELLALERNVGQTAALNQGLAHARTAWIARMDADDVSAPQRLEKQMKAIGENPTVRCVGTGIWEFRDNPMVWEIVKSRPEAHEEIWKAALHGSGMVHGTIVVSREALLDAGGYDERYRYASDREMFIRLLARYRAMNLQEPLLGVRRHPNQDSFSKIAADEYIQIYERWLTQGQFSTTEREILYRNLAYSHLFRARCFRNRNELGNWCRDEIQAIRISPKAWARNLLGTVSHHLLPSQVRTRLRKNFWNGA